jgi:hypothetical protein
MKAKKGPTFRMCQRTCSPGAEHTRPVTEIRRGNNGCCKEIRIRRFCHQMRLKSLFTSAVAYALQVATEKKEKYPTTCRERMHSLESRFVCLQSIYCLSSSVNAFILTIILF